MSCSFTEVISVVFRAPVGRDPCYSDKWRLVGASLWCWPRVDVERLPLSCRCHARNCRHRCLDSRWNL